MMLDLRVFVLAALVASPAGFLVAQGELALDEALTRLLVVMVGATAAAMAARTLWPLLAGTTPELVDADHADLALADLTDHADLADLADQPAVPETELLDDLFGFDDLESFGAVEDLSPLPE